LQEIYLLNMAITENRNFLVSVRLMTYNHGQFIRQAMEGILMQQTDFPFEVVIGDDFSSDDTLKIIKEFKSTEKISIRILDRKIGDNYWKKRNRKGRLYNFSNIIENCNGKYIALLDGDDYWVDSEKLQKQVDFMQANITFSACFHYTQVKDEEGSLGKIYGKNGEKILFSTEDTLGTTSIFHTSSLFFKKNAFIVPSWFFKVVSADMALFSIVSKEGMIGCIPEIMSIYRKHQGGITADDKTQFIRYHSNRIKLIKYLNKFHDYRFKEKAAATLKFHQSYLPESFFRSYFKKLKLKVKSLFPVLIIR
jgi:glycosyltransferase involved in cell wall biosynthesis